MYAIDKRKFLLLGLFVLAVILTGVAAHIMLTPKPLVSSKGLALKQFDGNWPAYWPVPLRLTVAGYIDVDGFRPVGLKGKQPRAASVTFVVEQPYSDELQGLKDALSRAYPSMRSVVSKEGLESFSLDLSSSDGEGTLVHNIGFKHAMVMVQSTSITSSGQSHPGTLVFENLY
jgi:hypothetical protein